MSPDIAAELGARQVIQEYLLGTFLVRRSWDRQRDMQIAYEHATEIVQRLVDSGMIP